MACRSFVAAWVLLIAASAMAQVVQGDPVTGNWGADGVTFLELLHNREGVVTGTAIWRHDGNEVGRSRIAKGTFDSETGRLVLAGETKNRDGETAAYLIDGIVDKDTLSGTYQVGNDKGEFRFTRLR